MRSSEKRKTKNEKILRQDDPVFIRWLVVTCVVGLIALGLLLNVRKNQVAQRDGMRKADLVKTAQILEKYFKNHKMYPQTVELPKDPAKQLYYSYKPSEDSRSYQLFARLENSKDTDVTATAADCGARCNYVITK